MTHVIKPEVEYIETNPIYYQGKKCIIYREKTPVEDFKLLEDGDEYGISSMYLPLNGKIKIELKGNPWLLLKKPYSL